MAISLRDATATDRIASLLPAWNLKSGDHVILAEAASPTRLVGAIAAGLRQTKSASSIALLDFTIYPRYRETDLLEQLVCAALTRCESRPVTAFQLTTPIQPESPELATFHRLGFTDDHQLIHYEFSVADFLARTRAVHDRVVRHGGIPAEAQIVPFVDRYWPDAARLVHGEGLIDASTLKQIDATGPSAHFSRGSHVVLLGGEIKGVILLRNVGRYCEVIALAVTPDLRGGNAWANTLLNYHATKVTSDLGMEIISMWAAPNRHPMTARLGRRMGSVIKETKLFLRK